MSQKIVGSNGASYGRSLGSGAAPSSNLGDVLERVLDKGLVIVGDIRVSLVDIELLTIKLRLVVTSLATAKEAGINWWEHDPWFSGDYDQRALTRENRELRERIVELEAARADTEDERRG